MGRNINELHPRLQSMIVRLQKECEKEKLQLGIGECFRTVEEQNALYALGRTKPGQIVTNAPGNSYSSQHQWGIAFDFYKNVKGHEYDDTAFFNRVGMLGKSLGLGWGGDWTGIVDRPHLYLPDWGSTPSALKKKYGTFERFRAEWQEGGSEISQMPGNQIVKYGQIHAADFCGAKIDADGIRGSETVKAGIMVLQKALNLDNNVGLPVDGIWGGKSRQALGKKAVKKGDRKYLVTAVEILLMLKNCDVGGVERPGIFGNGLEQAVTAYQKRNRLQTDGKAGPETFLSLIR